MSYSKADPTAPVVFYWNWAERFNNEVRIILEKQLADVFLLLWEKYYVTSSTWTELRTILKATSAERDLLSQNIPAFILRATDSMWHEVMSNMVSFDAGKAGKSVGNYVSLRKLAQLAESNHVQSLVRRYSDQVKPLKQVRNEHVDHWGLDALVVREEVKVLQLEIEVLFELVHSVLDAFVAERGLPLMPLPPRVSRKGGACDLLRVLKAAESHTHESIRH